MSGALQNITTPFKGSVMALVAHKLIELLGMSDADASYVSEALWVLLTAALTYMVPADLGLGVFSSRILGWLISLKTGAPVVAFLALFGLGGCSTQRDPVADCANAKAYLAQAEVIVSGLCANATTTTTLPAP